MAERTKRGETRERVYRFVRERLEAGQPPTVREVQDAFGFGAFQTAHGHLERLVADGRLAKRAGARGYCLPGDRTEPPAAMVPILGRVQAGALSTAVEDLEGYVSAKSTGSEDLFGLRVRGESMIGVGILPDDIVLVRSQPTADTGDIVVALVEDEATVKTLRVRRRRVELHPENP
ncbi:MAG: transcriptional repressor LexA, partial [Limisphaerales bacterium]